MHKFLKVTLASALIGFGTMGVVANLMTKEVKAVEIITHWVPHEVYGQIGEPDNNGKVFFSGLGAKYMGYPKDSRHHLILGNTVNFGRLYLPTVIIFLTICTTGMR